MSALAIERTTIPAGTWQVDPVHSSITFQVVDTTALFSTISGRFTEFEGTLEAGYDPESARAFGVIRAASITTDQEKRDAHLRSTDFFDVEKFPEVRFESHRIEAAGDDKVAVHGRLSIKDTPQDVVLTARVLAGQNEGGEKRLIFTGSGEVAWGPMTVTITATVTATEGD
jgi:polyisoprenoid-binding protein YceI